MSISLEGIFVPQSVRVEILGEDLEGPIFQVFNERPLCSVMRMIVKLSEATIRSFERDQLVDFDANPGDRACQLQAIKLRTLFLSAAIREELTGFKVLINDLKSKVHLRGSRNSYLKAADLPRNDFFKTHVSAKTVSEDLAYLLRCRMLKITRIQDKVSENGIVTTKTDPTQLVRVERALSFARAQSIAFKAAADLSNHSIRVIQGIANALDLPLAEKEQIKGMLGAIRQNDSPSGIPAKSFSCLFFQVQALMAHLKEERAHVVIKSIVKEGAEEHLFLELKEGDFIRTDSMPDPEIPLVVFHAVILDRDGLLKSLDTVGFTELILMSAACEEPFEPGSTIDQISEEGRGEVMLYRQKAESQPKVILLDHVFCNLMKNEVGDRVQTT